MFKNLLYTWLGLVFILIGVVFSFRLVSPIWLIVASLIGIIPFLIAMWHSSQQELDPNHIMALVSTAIVGAIIPSFVISIPLTLMFRPLMSVDENGLSYIFLVLSNIFITALPVLFLLHLITKRFQKPSIKETSLVFFALTGLICLPMLLLLSSLTGLPNSFMWFYYLPETITRSVLHSVFPEVSTTSVKLPDDYVLNIAEVDTEFLVVSNFRFNNPPRGSSYCPVGGDTLSERKRFVLNSYETFTVQFDDIADTISFTVPPFEVYIQPTTNFEKWQQITSCQSSVLLPKEVYATITHVLVVFIEPDMETFRAYTYNRQAATWQVEIVKGSRDYLK